MARVKTFTNGGSLLPGDLNSIEDDYEYAFSTYKTIAVRGGWAASAASGTLVLNQDSSVAAAAAVPVDATKALPIYIDPADYTANARTNKFRVRFQIVANAVAPTVNFTAGLYPVSTWGGASGNQPTVATIGTVVSGSTAAQNTPSASTAYQVNSGDFTAPAAGWHVLAVALSGSAAANSLEYLVAILQHRQV